MNKWIGIIFLLLIILFFSRPKSRVNLILKEQIKVFKTDEIDSKLDKVFLKDILIFVIIPIIIGIITSFSGIVISESVSGILATIFSLFFTLLFGVSTILVTKIEKIKNNEKDISSKQNELSKSHLIKIEQNEQEDIILRETFITLVSALILSLFCMLLCLINLIIQEIVVNQILTGLIITISLMIFVLILIVIKRTFILVLV